MAEFEKGVPALKLSNMQNSVDCYTGVRGFSVAWREANDGGGKNCLLQASATELRLTTGSLLAFAGFAATSQWSASVELGARDCSFGSLRAGPAWALRFRGGAGNEWASGSTGVALVWDDSFPRPSHTPPAARTDPSTPAAHLAGPGPNWRGPDH